MEASQITLMQCVYGDALTQIYSSFGKSSLWATTEDFGWRHLGCVETNRFCSHTCWCRFPMLCSCCWTSYQHFSSKFWFIMSSAQLDIEYMLPGWCGGYLFSTFKTTFKYIFFFFFTFLVKVVWKFMWEMILCAEIVLFFPINLDANFCGFGRCLHPNSWFLGGTWGTVLNKSMSKAGIFVYILCLTGVYLVHLGWLISHLFLEWMVKLVTTLMNRGCL